MSLFLSQFLSILFCVIVLSPFSPICVAEAEAKQAIGYGYTVRSVSLDSAGKSLAANLQLIKNSSVFRPDIQNLHLLAR